MNLDPSTAHAEAQTQAELGGLQQHSIGPLYPWAVVGRGLEGKWEVHNLQRGTVVFFGDAVWQGTCADALGVAHMAKQGIDFMTGYSARPEPLSAYQRALKASLDGTAEVGALFHAARHVGQTRLFGRPYAGRQRAGDFAISGTITGRCPTGYSLREAEALASLGEGLPPLDPQVD